MAGRKNTYSDAEIIRALKSCKGLVYRAAKKIGCSAPTIYNRAKENPKVKEVMKSERGTVVDDAEAKLFAAMQRGEPWAIQMILNCLGKGRGYIKEARKEVLHKGRLDHNHQHQHEVKSVNVHALVESLPQETVLQLLQAIREQKAKIQNGGAAPQLPNGLRELKEG